MKIKMKNASLSLLQKMRELIAKATDSGLFEDKGSKIVFDAEDDCKSVFAAEYKESNSSILDVDVAP